MRPRDPDGLLPLLRVSRPLPLLDAPPPPPLLDLLQSPAQLEGRGQVGAEARLEPFVHRGGAGGLAERPPHPDTAQSYVFLSPWFCDQRASAAD